MQPIEFHDRIIEPLQNAFTMIAQGAERANRREKMYYSKFSSVDGDVLESAVEHLIEHRNKNGFPLVSEIWEAVKEKQKLVNVAPKRSQEDVEAERLGLLAAEIMESDIGQLSMREGWGYCLWCTVAYGHQERFDAEDIEKFRAIHKEDMELIYEASQRNGDYAEMPTDMTRKNVALLLTPFHKNKELAEQYLKQGEAANIPWISVRGDEKGAQEIEAPRSEGYRHIGAAL